VDDHARFFFWNEMDERDTFRIWESIWTPSEFPAMMAEKVTK